jgi:hypothetical protein
MVPRLQKRGSSFKGVCAYILHDAGKATADRVDWTATQNLASHPEDAWFEMFETYRDSDQLKERAGRAARGRKNTAPVLHYMLSWAKDDQPTPEHMRETALSSLKALGLQDHQAVLSAHHDKEHLHVHIVVNTVNPDNGITAPLKFTKLDLSKWAEAYEKEHGIHCEERIKNNAERERHAKARRLDADTLLMGGKRDPSRELMRASRIEQKSNKPYVPVKHKATNRKQWLDKKEITDRMRVMRAALDAAHKGQRDATWARQESERDALDAKTDGAVESARQAVKDKYRPRWRSLYSSQQKEARAVDRLGGNLLDRAAFVFKNRERLGVAGKPLTLRQMLPLIRSTKNLSKRVANIHEQERRSLAREAKFEAKEHTQPILDGHKMRMSLIRDRHTAERQSQKDAMVVSRQSVSFAMAKAAIVSERALEPRPFVRTPEAMPSPERFREPAAKAAPIEVQQSFKEAVAPTPPAQLSRAEQIKRDNAEWARRNEGKDFGREL